MSPGKLFVLSAPSGAGKSTLKDRLMAHFDNLQYSISATTRKPRPGEVDGVHYFFRSPDDFRRMIDAGELVEFMEVHGNFYGTPKRYLDETRARGVHLILDLDVYGKVNFDKVYPDAIGILIVPPDIEELRKRLTDRNQDDVDTIRLRIRNASQELVFAQENGKYEYTVVNDDLDRAERELVSIVGRETASSHLPPGVGGPIP